MDGRGGARHVVDLVDLDEELLGHVVADDLKVRPVEQVLDVGLQPGEVVVERHDIVALVDQAAADVRAKEAAATRDKNAQERVLLLGHSARGGHAKVVRRAVGCRVEHAAALGKAHVAWAE